MRAAREGIAVILLLSTVALPGSADAQTAKANLQMHAGPGVRFPVVATASKDSALDLRGCVEGFRWCDVIWQNNRGWVLAEQVTHSFEGRESSVAEVGERLDVPLVGFSFATYWDDFYRNQPWYGDRERWQAMWRSQPDYLHFGRSVRANQSAGRVVNDDHRQGQTDVRPNQDQQSDPDSQNGTIGSAGEAPQNDEQSRGAGNEINGDSQTGDTGASGIGAGSTTGDTAGTPAPGSSPDGSNVSSNGNGSSGNGSRSAGTGSSGAGGSSGGGGGG